MNQIAYRAQLLLGVACVALVFGLVVTACSEEEEGDTITRSLAPVQVDRMGFPAINTALINSAFKDAFNRAEPRFDDTDWRNDMELSITAVRNDGNARGLPAEDGATTATALADILSPDVLSVDLASAINFPNGRALSDDVMDTVLQLVLNRTFITDAIANDSTFSSTFPYLAAPNP